jgi:hypothetical protein
MQPCCCWADIGNCYRATGRAESTHGLFLQHTRARVHLPPLLLRVSVFVFIILGRRGGRPAWAARRQAPTAINAPNSDKINSDSAACIVLSCLFKSRATFRCVRLLYTHNMHARCHLRNRMSRAAFLIGLLDKTPDILFAQRQIG